MIRYFSADPRRRREIIESLRERLAREDVAFAYLHGSFVELRFFRDIDVAVWARDPGRAEYYLVDLATSLTLDLGVPVDVQLLNAPLQVPRPDQGGAVGVQGRGLKTAGVRTHAPGVLRWPL